MTVSFGSVLIYLFIYLFKLHVTPIWVKQLQYKSMQTYKKKNTKKHKHNKYVNVGEIFDRRGPYRLKSSDCFMKVQTTDKRSEVGLSM
jgi:hypothetical protein